MQRNKLLERIDTEAEWDIIIIGGGATGLGAAVDASSRGYKTLLLEKFDFAKATSSRSTKLVHGGVRYLAQGNLKLVMEALRERGLLLENAPHLTHIQPFVLPVYSWWKKWYYALGLKIYDLMSGKLSIGNTRVLSSKKVIECAPAISRKGLSGGILYFDGQFDDARLAINLAQTAEENGGAVLNYVEVIGVIKENGQIKGVHARDNVSQKEYEIKTKSVINATGIFTDDILKMDDHQHHHVISPSQGIHLVIDKSFFPGDYALMVPKTDDGRVLFAVPWHNRMIVGTTDTPVKAPLFEPHAQEEEIAFVIRNVNRYLNTNIRREDVKAVFAGLRPLVRVPGQKNTSLMPRDHTIMVSRSNLVTITGGKWTTYRKMAKVAVDNALFVAKLERKACVTESLPIHGWCTSVDCTDPLHYYGVDAAAIRSMAERNDSWRELLHPDFPFIKAEVIWAVRNEMAITIEDVLARRIRLLFLDARAAMDTAPVVAQLMAEEMGKNEDWQRDQLQQFQKLAMGYLPN